MGEVVLSVVTGWWNGVDGLIIYDQEEGRHFMLKMETGQGSK